MDARGLYCPMPVLRLAQALRAAEVGAQVEVWASDPGVEADLPAWCQTTGHTLVRFERRAPDLFVAAVRKSPPR